MSKKSIVVGAVVLVAVTAGVVYFTDDSTEQSAATTASAANKTMAAAPATDATPGDAMSRGDAASTSSRTDSVPPDPRLAALQVSPDNGLIEFVADSNGKVIAEIDQDPASLGFGKPSREYTYAGDKVVQLTAYRYMSDHVEISRTMVAYKPDGSVDQIKESTSYERGPEKSR